jgi:hypothetical protein
MKLLAALRDHDGCILQRAGEWSSDYKGECYVDGLFSGPMRGRDAKISGAILVQVLGLSPPSVHNASQSYPSWGPDRRARNYDRWLRRQ